MLEGDRAVWKPGVYINFLGNEGEGRVRAAYGVNYERLVALKNRYDPTNFFALNQNIKPTIQEEEPCLRQVEWYNARIRFPSLHLGQFL